MMIISRRWCVCWCVFLFMALCSQMAKGQLALTHEKGFYACGSPGKYVLEVVQASQGDYAGYKIEWGDGKEDEYKKQKTMKHEYAEAGVYVLKFYGKSDDGWGTPEEYTVTAENTGISLNLEGETAGTQCKGTEITLVLTNLAPNSASTVYEVDYGDHKEGVTYGVKDLTANGDRLELKHVYDEPSCGEEGSGYMISLKVWNACGGLSEPKYGPYRVADLIKVSFDLPEKLCTEDDIYLGEITSVAPVACGSMEVRKKWWLDGEELVDDYVYFEKAGVYTIKASATMDGLDCGNDQVTKQIRIIERVKALVTPEKAELCAGSSVMLDASGSAGEEKRWTWSVVEGDASKVKFAPSKVAEKVDVTFEEPGDYKVKMVVTNGCSTDDTTVAVHVRKDPEVRKKGEIVPRCPEGSKGGTGLVVMENYVEYTWYNNQPSARWRVEPADGWTLSPTSHNSLAPEYIFTKPGDYQVIVEIPDAGCGAPAEQLTQRWTVKINDPSLTMDVLVADGKTEVCEGEEVRFRNATSAVQHDALTYLWTIKKNGGDARKGVDYEYATGNEKSGEPVLKFLTYGDYTVKVEARISCHWDEREFSFHVKKAPEITRFDLPTMDCTPSVLLLRRFVGYEWYNDTKRQVTWTVEGDADGWEYLAGTGAHDLTPEMKFTKPGEYRLRVDLAGVGCSGGKATGEQVLKILNPTIAKNITIRGNSVICEGGTVAFENHTVSDIPVEYDWVITSENGATEGNGFEFVGGTTAASEEPQIQFTRYGRYTVTAYLTTDCNRGTSPTEERFQITVQRDPEVILQALEGICPGEELVMDESLVAYHWNDNKEEVEWTVETAGGGASLEGVAYEAEALYPRFRFTQPGDYRIRVYLLNKAGCGGTASEAEQVVHVYDPAIRLEVTPVSKMVQEGEVFQFTNHSEAAETPAYSWSIVPADGWEWVDSPTAAAPRIRFERFGEYTVKVVMASRGDCRTETQEMQVTVKGVPEYRLAPELGAICEGSSVDMKQDLAYEAKGATIVPRWTVSPGVEGTDYVYVNAGGATEIQPEIRFLKNGRYTLTLRADAEYGGMQEHVTHVNVLRRSVTARTLDDRRGCTKTGSPLELELTNHSEGDSLAYAWRVEPAAGWSFAAGGGQSRQPKLRITEAGDYRVVLRAENICDADEAEFKIHAYTNPEIAPVEDIRDECDRFYVFRSEEVVRVDSNGGRLEWVKWTISPEGYAYVDGFGDSAVETAVTFRGGETPYRVKLEVKNGCGDVIAEDFTILVDEYREIVPLRDTALCSMSGDYLLKAEPGGGVWTCPAHAVEHRQDGYYFVPKEETEQRYRLYYSYGHKSCLAVDSLDLTVHPLPSVEVEADKRDVCVNGEAQKLEPGMPTGGEWRLAGAVVTDFDPAAYGEGVHRLEYWFTEASTGCSNLDTLKMVVHGLPDASFGVADRQCRGVDSLYVPAELGQGHRFEWDFSTGVKVTEDAPAAWHYAAVGEYAVSMRATSVYGCVSEPYRRQVKVLDQPPTAEFVLRDTAGCGPFTTRAEVESSHFRHPQGDYYELGYLWEYGNGKVSGELEPLEQTYEPALYDTVYRMHFHVFNVCGEERDSADVGVWSSAVAHFTMNPDPESARGFCTPITPVFINGSTGSGATYTWDFSGLGSSHAVDTVYTFTTGVSPSVFTVTLTAANRCNPGGSEASRTFKVKPNPIVAGFTMSEKYVCAGDTVCFTNNSVDREEDEDAILSYAWEFGDGEVSDLWEDCHAYPVAGRYPVTLSLDNGCARRSFTDSVMVHAVPQLTLFSDTSALCEDAELRFWFETSEPLKRIEWDFGDGEVLSAGSERRHVFEEPGNYQVKVSGYGAQIPSCPGEALKDITVWSKPRVTITPLDTMVCPVFLYAPEVTCTSYDYFTWDYGDGSPLTSDMSHEYVNESPVIETHHWQVEVVNNYGCSEKHAGMVRVYNAPVAEWDKEISYGRPEKVRFINLSRDYTDCYWYLPDGVVHSRDDQTVEFPEEGVYPIALVAVNEYGCRDSVFQDYRSYEGGLYFPNAFIPHSGNPKVNRFNGVGMGLKEYKLEIYDLYGNMVWMTTALEGGMPSEGWDGRNREGVELPQGVYMWRAEAIFYSEDVWTGKNNRSGNPQTTQGSVLLLRE